MLCDKEQLELDEVKAKEALKRYLEHYFPSERNSILENLVCELDKENIIDVEWVEIY